MSPRRGRGAPRSAETVAELLDATTRILVAEGAGGVSIQRVADAAGKSKGLVHYHFAGKDALLVACAARLTAEVIARDERAVAAGTPTSALDRLWEARASTLADGTHVALVALAAGASDATRPSLAESLRQRREAAEGVVGAIASRYAFAPRAPLAALAQSYVALCDGIALAHTARPHDDHRAPFDAFWLAVLSSGA